MDRRSTNAKGFVHYGGDVTSGAEQGIGVRLGGASTGSTVWIESVSDDTNAHLGIRAQGAGTITIGTSSNAVALGGSLTVGSGATFKGAYSTTFAWALAALTSGAQGEITLTTAVSSNLTVGDLIGMIDLGVATAGIDDLAIQSVRLSATASSIVTIVVTNVGSTGLSTTSGTLRITWLDLT